MDDVSIWQTIVSAVALTLLLDLLLYKQDVVNLIDKLKKNFFKKKVVNE